MYPFLQWVRSNEEHRRPKMEDILGAVRCHYLSPSFLKDQMKNCDILKKVFNVFHACQLQSDKLVSGIFVLTALCLIGSSLP